MPEPDAMPPEPPAPLPPPAWLDATTLRAMQVACDARRAAGEDAEAASQAAREVVRARYPALPLRMIAEAVAAVVPNRGTGRPWRGARGTGTARRRVRRCRWPSPSGSSTRCAPQPRAGGTMPGHCRRPPSRSACRSPARWRRTARSDRRGARGSSPGSMRSAGESARRSMRSAKGSIYHGTHCGQVRRLETTAMRGGTRAIDTRPHPCKRSRRKRQGRLQHGGVMDTHAPAGRRRGRAAGPGGKGPPLLVLHHDIGTLDRLPLLRRAGPAFRRSGAASSRLGTMRGRNGCAACAISPWCIAGCWRISASRSRRWSASASAAGSRPRWRPWRRRDYRTLVLVGAMGIKPPEGDILDQAIVSYIEYARAGFHDQAAFDARLWRRTRAPTAREVGHLPRDELPHRLEALHVQPDACRICWAACSAPALVVWGDDDKVVPVSAGERLCEAAAQRAAGDRRECRPLRRDGEAGRARQARSPPSSHA